MKTRFYRLYIIIILLASSLFWLFGKLYDKYTFPGYELTVEQIFSSVQNKNNLFNYSAILESELPTKLQQDLSKGKIIKLSNEKGSFIFLKKNSKNQLLQFGPIKEKDLEQSNDFLIILIFYLALALMLILILKPVFSDLEKILQAANDFSKKPVKMDIQLKKSSHIAPLATTFNKMSSQISEFIELHQDLSRTIAHEIRTPLSRMKFICESLTDDKNNSKIKNLYQNIVEIEDLVHDYLHFAKLETHKDQFEKTKENIKDWLGNQVEKLNKNGLPIRITLNCNIETAYFQKKFLERALHNLIFNACQFAQSTILITFHTDNGWCYLSVEDDGPGILFHNNDIFHAFKRSSSNKRYQGFGLGLYISRKVAIWHGGSISYDNSTFLKGAKFTLQWPDQK